MVLILASNRPATGNNRYRGLRQFFRWMVVEGEIEYSQLATLKPPTVPRGTCARDPRRPGGLRAIRAAVGVCATSRHLVAGGVIK